MVYMGISYNAAELPGDIWMNNGVNGVLDAAANGLGIVLLAKIGRKHLLFWSLTLTGKHIFKYRGRSHTGVVPIVANPFVAKSWPQ